MVSILARLSTLAPWLSVLAVGAGAYLIGKHFQSEERKRRELRRKKMITTFPVVGGVTQALHPTWEYPQGLGRMQQGERPKQQGQRFTH